MPARTPPGLLAGPQRTNDEPGVRRDRHAGRARDADKVSGIRRCSAEGPKSKIVFVSAAIADGSRSYLRFKPQAPANSRKRKLREKEDAPQYPGGSQLPSLLLQRHVERDIALLWN